MRASTQPHNPKTKKTMAPVYLNVYDLSPHNALLQCLGFGGVYHSGVEAHGVEYAYGAHAHACSGVFATPPRECAGAVGFRTSLYVGETDLAADQVQALVARMGARRYHGNRYHLLQHNCNAFAAELSAELTRGRGLPPPAWVNRLAGLAVALHCLLPASWVPPLIMVPPPTAGGQQQQPYNHFDERQPLVGGGGVGFGGGGSSSAEPHRSALVAPPTATMPERLVDVENGGNGSSNKGAIGRGGGGGGGGGGWQQQGAGAGGAAGARRPGTAWPAYEEA
jgi:hypothetical protein